MAEKLFGSPQMAGILCAMLASVAFTLNDVGIKYLSDTFPLHEVVLVRAAIALSLTVAILMPMEGGLGNISTRLLGIHLLRGLLVVAANMSFFMGLATVPLSEATAVFFVAPLLVTVFSVIFLGEPVGILRWAAVLAGLAGAFLMLLPGSDSFQPAALLPLIAALCYATVHILTRRIRGTERASTMAFYIQITFVFVSLLFGLTVGDGRYEEAFSEPSMQFLLRGWIMPQGLDLLIMLGIGICSAAGAFCISQAYRLCEAALIAPFEYLALVLAIFWGVTLFGEWPDPLEWLGILLVLAAGLFVIWRQSRPKPLPNLHNPDPLK